MMSSLTAELLDVDRLKLIIADLMLRSDPDVPDGAELDAIEPKPSRCGAVIIDSTKNDGLTVNSVSPFLELHV